MKNIILISFLFLFCACHKKKDIHISAINPANGQPWPGLHYTITKQKTGAFEEKYKKVGEGYLDENGKAVHTLRLGNASYEINIESPENICYVNNASYTFESNSSNFDFVFKLTPCAYSKRNINNINCMGANDSIIVFTQNNSQSFSDLGWLITGCSGYQGDHFSSVPMGYQYYRWEVTRSGITNVFYDTIFIAENEYRTYDINY